MKKIPGKGPKGASIAIIGEFPVDADTQAQDPFASAGGWHLKNWLAQVGIKFEDCYRTYLFKETPPGNDLRYLCKQKKEVLAELPPKTKYPHQNLASKGSTKLFLPLAKANEVLDGIKAEIEEVQPNVVLALGRANSWAFLGTPALDNTRGRVAESTLIPGQKVLPTYGPIHVLRSYSDLPIMLADFDKARRESAFKELRIPPREIWINPTLDDCWDFYNRYIAVGCKLLSVDIETEREQITCIGFAPDNRRALVVPIWDKDRPGWNYWPTVEDELKAWAFINHVVSTHPRFLFQNGMYDFTFSLLAHKLVMRNPVEDTMLLHHALQPEMDKGLGFLASLHTDAPAWKAMYREAKAKESMKADD